MIYELFAIYDVRANALDMSIGIIPSQNVDMVKRGVASAMMQGSFPDLMRRYPEDFYLERVGALETVEKEIVSKNERVCCLADLVKGDNQNA